MKRVVHNTTATLAGQTIQISVEIHGRLGTSSPETWYIRYKDRLISPYEQRIKGWKFSLDSLFKIVYYDAIKHLIPRGIGLLDKLQFKNKDYSGDLYSVPVVLGIPS